jgi:hypothetical protein
MKGYAKLGAVLVIVVLLLSSILFVNADKSMNESVKCVGCSVEEGVQGSGVRGQGSGCRDGNENVFDDFTQGTLNGTLIDENNDLTLGWQPLQQPYVKDENTTLLCHFDDNLTGVDGEEALMYEKNQTGLVGYWKFDEGSGTKAYDSSGKGNDGTWNGWSRANWTVGISGNALKFDGIDDYVDCGGDNSLNVTNEITIEAWIKLDNLNDKRYIFLGKGDFGTGQYAMEINETKHLGGFLGTNFDNSWKYTDDLIIKDLDWHHIALAWDGINRAYYLDGVKSKTIMTEPGTLITTSHIFAIGRPGSLDLYHFNGTIDEVSIYDRAKSSEEIYSDYLAMKMPFLENGKFNNGVNIDKNETLIYPNSIFLGANCVGYWNFNEESGPNVYDKSVFANHGTLGGDGVGTDLPTRKIGKFRYALDFDGTDDYLEVPDDSTLNFGQNDFTITAWIKTNMGSVGRILSKGADGNGGYLFGIDSDGTLRVALQSSGPVTVDKNSIGTYNDNLWHHIAFIVDRTNDEFTIFADGKKDGGPYSISTIGSIDISSPLLFGKGESHIERYDGLLDEVSIHSYKKTALEIYQDFLGNYESNFHSQIGTIELFVQPTWNGTDGENHTIFFT